MSDSTTRFTERVGNYIKYRPSYPPEIIPILEKRINLNNSMILADVGSGTGKLSELFLKYGCKVIGIEPNEAMRLVLRNFFLIIIIFKVLQEQLKKQNWIPILWI